MNTESSKGSHCRTTAPGRPVVSRKSRPVQFEGPVVGASSEEILALSKLSCAIIRQAARDLFLDTDILPGMTKWQIELRKKNRAHRTLAYQWVSDTTRSTKFPFSDCCYYISEALTILRGEQADPMAGPAFPEELVREALLTRPHIISQHMKRLGFDDDLDDEEESHSSSRAA